MPDHQSRSSFGRKHFGFWLFDTVFKSLCSTDSSSVLRQPLASVDEPFLLESQIIEIPSVPPISVQIRLEEVESLIELPSIQPISEKIMLLEDGADFVPMTMYEKLKTHWPNAFNPVYYRFSPYEDYDMSVEDFKVEEKKDGGEKFYRLNSEGQKHGPLVNTGTGQKKNGITTVTYENGVKHGPCEFYGPESVSFLAYQNDVRHGPFQGWGPGRFSRPGETMYQTSMFVDGKKEGQGVNYYCAGLGGDYDKYTWEDDQIHGYYYQKRAAFLDEPAYEDHLEYNWNERTGILIRDTTDQDGNRLIKWQKRREDEFAKVSLAGIEEESVAMIVEMNFLMGNFPEAIMYAKTQLKRLLAMTLIPWTHLEAGDLRENEKDDDCSICASSLAELLDKDTQLVRTPCDHVFCKNCLYKWLDKNQCPLCKRAFRADPEDQNVQDPINNGVN